MLIRAKRLDRGRSIFAACPRSRKSASKTHIAFIGTALLARSTDQRTDVHSLHVKAGTPGAYSARSLAKDVLVPASRELRMHLGVTGREPLNNQPYFHNDVVSRRMNVKGNAKVALDLVCDLLDELFHKRPFDAAFRFSSVH